MPSNINATRFENMGDDHMNVVINSVTDGFTYVKDDNRLTKAQLETKAWCGPHSCLRHAVASLLLEQAA